MAPSWSPCRQLPRPGAFSSSTSSFGAAYFIAIFLGTVKADYAIDDYIFWAYFLFRAAVTFLCVPTFLCDGFFLTPWSTGGTE